MDGFVLPELRQPEHKVDDTSQCNAEDKIHWSFTFTPTGVQERYVLKKG
jgi:hypothetical protein